MKRSLLILGVLFVFVLTLGSLAFAGGKLVIYSSVDEENANKILSAFSEDTGIKVSFVHLSSGPALARIEAEKNRPQADVWFGAPYENHIIAKDRGLTQPYVSPNAKNLAPNFKDKDGYWTCFYMNPLGVAVNMDQLKKLGAPVPTSWEDLLNPAYKGQIQAPTPQSSGTAYNMVMTLITIMGEDEAFKYMAKLNKNIQTYTSSGTGPSKAVAVGQCAIGIQFTPAFFEFIDKGYPLKVVFPKEGVGFESPSVSIIKGAKHLDEAKKLVDWLISKKGQDTLSEKKTFFYPVLPSAKLGKGMPPFSSLKIITFDGEWAAKNKKRLVQRWVNEVLSAK